MKHNSKTFSQKKKHENNIIIAKWVFQALKSGKVEITSIQNLIKSIDSF